MNRREFIKTSVVAGAGMLMPSGIILAAALPELSVATGDDPARNVRAAVNAIGGIRKFVSIGDIVLVKPNIGWDRAPEYAATTNPYLVAEIVRMCLDAGAKKVRVFDNTCDDARRCYQSSMIEALSKKAGADVYLCDERRFKETSIGGDTLKTWPIYQDAMESDKIINVPVAKHHSLSKLTLGIKNMMGVMGGHRGMLHIRFDRKIVDMAKFMRPNLTILDATRIVVSGGPNNNSLKDVKKLNTVVAGSDVVAVDSYGATLFGMTGADVGCVSLAAASGLGKIDLRGMNIARVKG